MDESFQDPAVADATPDNLETPSAPPEPGTSAEPVEFFDEKFDPSSLDENLLPAYKQMQGAFTKKTQTIAEERKALEAQLSEAAEARQFIESLQSDPDTQRALYEQLSELADQWDDPDNFDDPAAADEFVDPEVAQLRQRIDQIEHEKQTEQLRALNDQALTADLQEIVKLNNGEQLSEPELEILGQFIQPDENGVLRALPAYKAMQSLFEIQRKKWIDGKTSAPTPPGNGAQGSEKFDISDRQSRLKRMAAIINAGD